MQGDATAVLRNERRRREGWRGRPGFQRERPGEIRQPHAARSNAHARARRRRHRPPDPTRQRAQRPPAVYWKAAIEVSAPVDVRSTVDGLVEGAERRQEQREKARSRRRSIRRIQRHRTRNSLRHSVKPATENCCPKINPEFTTSCEAPSDPNKGDAFQCRALRAASLLQANCTRELGRTGAAGCACWPTVSTALASGNGLRRRLGCRTCWYRRGQRSRRQPAIACSSFPSGHRKLPSWPGL